LAGDFMIPTILGLVPKGKAKFGLFF